MAVPVTCTCGASYRVKRDLVGKRLRCPKCREVLKVSAPVAEVSSQENLSLEPPDANEATGVSVACTSCHKPMSADARICTSCGYDAQTGRHLSSVVDAAGSPPPEPTDGLSFEEDSEKIVVTTSSSKLPGLLFLAFAPFLVLGLASLWGVFGGYLLGKVAMVLFLPVSIAAACYAVAVLIFERTTVTVDKAQLTRRVGPIPWPILFRNVPAEKIQHFYIVERHRIKWISMECDSIADVASTAVDIHDVVTQGPVNIWYDLYAVLANGWRIRLLTLPDLKAALSIKERFRRYLRVKNVPVISTWYQHLLLRERTRHDSRSPASAISAKSLPVPLVFLELVGLALAAVLTVSTMTVISLATPSPQRRHTEILSHLRDFEGGHQAGTWVIYNPQTVTPAEANRLLAQTVKTTCNFCCVLHKENDTYQVHYFVGSGLADEARWGELAAFVAQPLAFVAHQKFRSRRRVALAKANKPE